MQEKNKSGMFKWPVYGYRPCLANSMTTIFSLTVNLRIEIHVMDDDSIGTSQV